MGSRTVGLATIEFALQQPIQILGGGLAGRKPPGNWRAAGWRFRLYEMRPVRSRPPPTVPTGSPNWSAAIRSKPIRRTPRPGCSRKNCAGWIRCCCEAPASARVPGGPRAHRRSRPLLGRSVTKPSRTELADRDPARGSDRASPPMASCIVATGPLTSDALAADIARLTGSGPVVLLRQHQPDRRRRSTVDTKSPFPPRATASRSTARTTT
jgi:methylenetetrahydrofolate--tRNA-(uracil-5-)-methyltransferase